MVQCIYSLLRRALKDHQLNDCIAKVIERFGLKIAITHKNGYDEEFQNG